jgi:hypothetical protein
MTAMETSKPPRKQLEALSQQIKKDQATTNPAEKRVKISTSFKNAIKKMGRTPPPKKEGK